MCIVPTTTGRTTVQIAPAPPGWHATYADDDGYEWSEPVAAWALDGIGPVLYAVVAMAALLVERHRLDIIKLLRGEESRVGERSRQTTENKASVS